MADQRRQVPARLPADLIDRLDTRCGELGMVRNTAVQRALEAWLGDEVGSEPLERALTAIEPQPTPLMAAQAPRTRMTMDDVRPPFTPRLKKKT